MQIVANGINIEVEDSGAGPDADGKERPVVLLIMGLAMQLVAWPLPFVQALVDAGYRVIRFDNRDIGLSRHFDEQGVPNVVWAALKLRLGGAVKTGYTLTDMARDTLGVLDALNVQKAHIVGVSMGGMIAQRVALAAPGRTLSLTSIMSTSGAQGLPKASAKVQLALLGKPSGRDEDAVVRHYIRLFQTIGSPGFPHAPGAIEERVRAAVRRCYRPQGVARQTLASIADASRAHALSAIRSPTLVLHGKDDPLVPFVCGADTARRIAGARLEGLAGMGHDLPPGVVDWLMAQMIPHLAAA